MNIFADDPARVYPGEERGGLELFDRSPNAQQVTLEFHGSPIISNIMRDRDAIVVSQHTSQFCRCCCFQPNIDWKVFDHPAPDNQVRINHGDDTGTTGDSVDDALIKFPQMLIGVHIRIMVGEKII